MNISEVLESLIVSTQVNNNIKFTGKIPSEFINKWDELTTENLIHFLSKRLGHSVNPNSVQFINY